MKITRRDVFAGGVAVLLFSAVAALTLSTQTYAQGTKRQQAQVTGELDVPIPGFPPLIRIEDPEYKVVCYYPKEGIAISCVKR
jgi:hypothetical protein